MTSPDPRKALVREWVEKAEGDLRTAEHTLKLKTQCPTDTVCFHAQQAVEKYLKALLVSEGIDFPKTHDIEKLTSMLPVALRPPLSPAEEALLTDYATTTRYPGNYGPISLMDARKALRIAKLVRKLIRRQLQIVVRP